MWNIIFSWPVIIICIILGALYKYLTWHFDVFNKYGIKGPKPIVLLGTMLPMIQKGILQFDIDTYKMYGKIRGEFRGRLPFIVIHDVQILKEILIKRFDNFTARFDVGTFDSPMDKAITVLDGDHWRLLRNIMSPTFSSGKLRRMNNAVNECADTVLKNLSIFAKDKTTFDFRKYCGAYIMDVICSTAFGMKINSNDDPQNAFVKMAKKSFDFRFVNPTILLFFFFPILMRPAKYLGFSLFPKDVITFFTDVINKAIETKSTQLQKEKDFLQLMMNAHSDENDDDHDEMKQAYDDQLKWTRKCLSKDEIIANSILFFMAGYETTANTISFLGHHLAIQPDIQEKLYQEIINYTHNGKEEITIDLVQKMAYLDMCINETLRMYPPGPRNDRVANNDITINGLFIEKGMNISIPIYSLHMDPDVWPQPTKFDPLRFSADEKEKRDPCYFIPFSIGPRKCIGMRLALMEIKILITRIILKFKFIKAPETEDPIKIEKLLVKAINGINLQVEERI